jgi:hypothetical protein
MPNSIEMIVAMAEKCADTIVASGQRGLEQPESLQPVHLKWMCEEIVKHAGDWPATKLHRWIGFIQGAMIANRMIDLEGARAMFDQVKNAYGELGADLLDHLDPASPFQLDLGGQG